MTPGGRKTSSVWTYDGVLLRETSKLRASPKEGEKIKQRLVAALGRSIVQAFGSLLPRAFARALLGAAAFRSLRFTRALSSPSHTPTGFEKVARTLQPQKMAPTGKTPTERSHTYLGRLGATLRHPVSTRVHSFSTLTHHILHCHRLCHPSTARATFFAKQFRAGNPVHCVRLD